MTFPDNANTFVGGGILVVEDPTYQYSMNSGFQDFWSPPPKSSRMVCSSTNMIGIIGCIGGGFFVNYLPFLVVYGVEEDKSASSTVRKSLTLARMCRGQQIDSRLQVELHRWELETAAGEGWRKITLSKFAT